MQHYRNVDNTMRAYPEIAANWAEAGITADKWVAFYCGTGWRASETWFYAYLQGWDRIAVYDGGWFEWSQDPVNNPIEIGDPDARRAAGRVRRLATAVGGGAASGDAPRRPIQASTTGAQRRQRPTAPWPRTTSWNAADVEPAAERRPGRVAEPQDLELAELVGQRLAGHREVAVDLVGDVVLGERGVLDHERDRPVAAPAHRVEARVDDEPAGPPGVERQDPEPVHVAGQEAHLGRQPLAVEAPALDVGGRAGQAPERRQAVELLGDRDLEMVAGNRLVEGERPRPRSAAGSRARSC